MSLFQTIKVKHLDARKLSLELLLGCMSPWVRRAWVL
jgi:hypothetical protein